MKLIALFSVFTPIGISIGWSMDSDSEIIEIIFNSLAAGTFIYIACSEVIIEEFSMPDNKILKLFFFMFGVACITCLKLIEAH